MHYLHTRRPLVIHGDLRSPNLLLDLTIENNSPRFHVKCVLQGQTVSPCAFEGCSG
jgi:hypothetical protein